MENLESVTQVVCINDVYDKPTSFEHRMSISMGKIYNVLGTKTVKNYGSDKAEFLFKIINDNRVNCWYTYNRFLIPLDEYKRRNRQKKIVTLFDI